MARSALTRASDGRPSDKRLVTLHHGLVPSRKEAPRGESFTCAICGQPGIYCLGKSGQDSLPAYVRNASVGLPVWTRISILVHRACVRFALPPRASAPEIPNMTEDR